MITIARVNLKNPHQRGEYIGRKTHERQASPLGNPFWLDHERRDDPVARAYVIHQFDYWLRMRIRAMDRHVISELERLLEIAKTGDLQLLCWCAPRECHGDIIRKQLEHKLRHGRWITGELPIDEYLQPEVQHA
jgi:Domain of unknown function (DUF4326)